MPKTNQSSNVSAPGDDDKYIQPIIGKMGWDTEYPQLYGLGYSRNNGLDFHVFASFDGLIFNKGDIDNIWNAGVSDRVKKEVDSATAEIPSAVSNASEAVKRADSAVANSKVNSDAIKAMQSAASEAKAEADKAISDAQAAIKNVASDTEAIRQNVASVERQVNSAQAANDSQAKAMQTDLDKAKQSILDISKNLDKVSANLDTYAKSAAEQGHDITELKNQQGLIEADLASANGNVTQLQATVNGLQGNLKDTDSDVASLSATASQAGLALKNAQSQVAQVIARADKFQATIAEQDKKIVDIKATADGASVAASNANSTATEAKLTASAASVTASDAKSDVLTATTTANDAKLLATNANSQAMEANATANNVSIKLSGVEKTANNAASQANVATSKADSNAKQINSVANTVTTVQASVEATQKELSGKVDQATIDSTNKKLEDINAQVSVVAGEVRSKAEQTTVNGISTDLNDLKAKAESIEKDDIDFNDCKSQMNIFSKGPKNAPNDNYWWYLRVEPGTEGRVTQYAVSDRDNHHYTRQFISTSWTPWKETADSNDVANLQAQVDKHSTEISNNTKEIQLKADSQTVNEINQTVQQQQAQQKILADQISSKVSSADVEKMVDGKGFATKDLVESSITQASGKINETITNLQGNLQNVTADLTGLQSTVKDKADQSQITQLTNVVQSKVSSDDYQTTISQLTNDINAKVSKGDLMSQINIEAGRLLFQSNKIFLDADNIVFGKNSKAFIPDAAITNLSLDKLTAGQLKIPIADQYGNEIVMGNSGINVLSAPEKMKLSNEGQKDDVTFKLNVSAHGVKFTEHVNYNKNGQHVNPSDNFDFLKMEPDVLHHTNGASDAVKTPSGMALYVPYHIAPDLGPSSPGGFLALGYGKTEDGQQEQKGIDVAYVTRAINGWEEGLNVRTMMYMQPTGADHEMRTTWVSWSNWDGGEHYPAIVNGPFNYGGIAFPKSSKVTLFDAYGHAMWPTQSVGTYNVWGGK